MPVSGRLPIPVDRSISGQCLRLQPPVIVVQADNVILAEVVAMLNLNEQQGDRARVLNAMGSAAGDIDGISGVHLDGAAIQGDHALPCDHEPVLRAALVPLVAQPLARADLERLDLEAIALG
jgi:hypothetical protein